MRSRPVAAAVAIASGLIVLIAAFVPLPFMANLRALFVQWAVIVAGAAVFVGVGNLFSVHLQKIRRREKNSMYSLLLLVSLIGVFLLGMIGGPNHPVMQFTVNSIIVPVEASLMALLAVTLVYASIRLLRHRADWMTIVFLITVVVTLASSVLMSLLLPGVSGDLRAWIESSLAGGGARGLVMGVALGALTTGLRVIMGLDRPYGGK